MCTERLYIIYNFFYFFFSSRRRHTRFDCDWSSDVCSSDLPGDDVADAETPDRDRAERAIEGCGHSFPDSTRPSAATRVATRDRSEERRVGKECRSRGAAYHLKKI